jgi:hypothetical protein
VQIDEHELMMILENVKMVKRDKKVKRAYDDSINDFSMTKDSKH